MGSKILASTTGSIAEIEKGAKGATERPRSWDEIPDGSAIESGTGNEQWIDIVLYGDDFYQCIRSLTKGNGVVPTNTIYFVTITDYKRLATGLFLARKAYIHNLGVDNILITDQGEGKGNVLLKADKNGIVCKSGTFEDITVTCNGTFEGAVKTNMFYGKVKKVTPGTTYQIDPVREPYNFYYVENPTNRTFIILPKAANYEGLEINIFTKLSSSSSSLSYRTIVEAQTNDDLYVKQNTAIVPSNIAVEKINVEYTNFKNDSVTTTANSYIRFKCIGGAWYAISGQFTGE